MATGDQVRDWARNQGYSDVSDRGRIPARLAGPYNDAHPDDPYEMNSPAGLRPAPPADYPDADFESAFADDPDPAEGMTESAPVRPKDHGKTSGMRTIFGSRKNRTGGKQKLPRISTEGIWGGLWRGLAAIAAPVPPLQRTLRVQAPVAGLLLDDAVKGTIADPVLQPLARLAGAGKAASALMGPPVFVTAITVYGQQCAQRGEQPNALIWQGLDEGLTASLMAWFEISEGKFEEVLRREREFEEKHGQTIEAMKDWLFSPPPMSDVDLVMEEAAVRRAQGIPDDLAA